MYPPSSSLAELRRQPHWSFSSLNQILNICSQQYAFRKVEELQPEFVPGNLIFGSAMHRCLSQLYRSLKEGASCEEKELHLDFAATLLRLVEAESLPVRFGEEKDLDWHLEKGQQMLLAVLHNLDPDDRVIGVDIPFMAEFYDEDGMTLSKPLIGEFDALVENKGRLVVVDFKTAAAKWPAPKAHTDLQATAYLMALRQNIEQRGSLFRYDVITKTKNPEVTRYWTDRTPSDFLRLARLAQRADQIVAQGLYYPHDACISCSGCPYANACLQWQRVAGADAVSHSDQEQFQLVFPA